MRKNYEKTRRWLLGLAERQVTLNDNTATFVSDMYFEAEEAISTLEAENARLKEALGPFADVSPSSLYAADGSEGESYNVSITGKNGSTPCDFTGYDLANARAALACARGQIEEAQRSEADTGSPVAQDQPDTK